MSDNKKNSPGKLAAILVFLMLVIIVCVVVLASKGCPPIPIPAGQPAPAPSAPPITAPEVQPHAVELTTSKPDLGIPQASVSG